MTNCPNCGAPWYKSSDSCLYCGTYMYDLTDIDFTTDTPVYLKLKTEIDGKECTINQLCIPKLNSIEITSDSYNIVDWRGSLVKKCISHKGCLTNIEFEAIPEKDGTMFKLCMEEQ